jgi:hypothetical protein
MTRMLNLRNVFELVNDGLNDRPFAQQELVRQMHEPVFHEILDRTDNLDPTRCCCGTPLDLMDIHRGVSHFHPDDLF